MATTVYGLTNSYASLDSLPAADVDALADTIDLMGIVAELVGAGVFAAADFNGTAGAGLDVDISAGKAIVGAAGSRKYVRITGSSNVAGLTGSTTNYVYLNPDGTLSSNTTGTPGAGAHLLLSCVTNTTNVTSVNNAPTGRTNLLALLTQLSLAGVARGDILRRNSSSQWANLAVGANATRLGSNGTDPSWSAISSAEVTTALGYTPVNPALQLALYPGHLSASYLTLYNSNYGLGIDTSDLVLFSASGVRVRANGPTGTELFRVDSAGQVSAPSAAFAGVVSVRPLATSVPGITFYNSSYGVGIDTSDLVLFTAAGGGGNAGIRFRDSGVGGTELARITSAGKMLASGGIGVGNSAAGSTLGTVVKKIEVFDAAGASLGYLAVYDAIT